MNYRSDIAGLRAVAVVPILLMHAGVPYFSAGYVGVDIFFVISGYLITGLILRDLDKGDFALAAFFRRRVVRILPALGVMLLASLLAGCLLLFPGELRDLGKSAVSASLLVANLHFWRTSDYFGPDAERLPLIHTWSLGVEEQFYLIYPLLLLAIVRFMPRHLTACLAACALLSFLFSWWLASVDAGASFYLFPSRAWELLLGALAAAGAFPRFAAPAVRRPIAGAGMLMILVSLMVVGRTSGFPAPWGLLPVTGTALLIAYGDGGATARLLSLPPVRWIGDVSYSLYLWHWPIMAFYRLERGSTLGRVDVAVTIALSLIAAYASYRLVELPFLRRFRAATAPPVLIVGVGVLGVLALVSLAVATGADRIRPVSFEARKVLQYSGYRETDEARYQFRSEACFPVEDRRVFDRGTCLRLMRDRPNVLLAGDSHAGHLWRALAERHPDVNLLQATAPACRPHLPATGGAACESIIEEALGRLAAGDRISRVILSARWRPEEAAATVATVRLLLGRGVPVTVVGPSVEYGEPMPRLLARAIQRNDFSIVGSHRRHELKEWDRELRRMVVVAGGDYVSLYETECPEERCQLFTADGGPMRFDATHLTLAAARELVARNPVF